MNMPNEQKIRAYVISTGLILADDENKVIYQSVRSPRGFKYPSLCLPEVVFAISHSGSDVEQRCRFAQKGESILLVYECAFKSAYGHPDIPYDSIVESRRDKQKAVLDSFLICPSELDRLKEELDAARGAYDDACISIERDRRREIDAINQSFDACRSALVKPSLDALVDFLRSSSASD